MGGEGGEGREGRGGRVGVWEERERRGGSEGGVGGEGGPGRGKKRGMALVAAAPNQPIKEQAPWKHVNKLAGAT